MTDTHSQAPMMNDEMNDERPPLLALKGIDKIFRNGDMQVQVLHSIDLQVYQGQMVAIIGASGSGKSTLMNIMACLDVPSGGEYLINGRTTSQMNKEQLASLRREYFGFIFQRYQLLNLLSAEENVAMPAIYAGADKGERLIRAKALLAKLGLGERSSYLPTQLSGGQQQRVSIARALMNGGQIIFADEPTGALDSKSGLDVMQILTELNAAGHTVILVTHDPKVARYASRVIEIKDGRILSDIQQTQSLPTADTPLDELTDNASDGTSDSVANSISDDTSDSIYNDVSNGAFDNTFDSSPISQANPTHQPAHHIAHQAAPIPSKSLPQGFDTPVFTGLKEALRMALLTMVMNKVRTLLTMLGIIIGIASVVLIVALGDGSKQQVLKDINQAGTSTLSISAGANIGSKDNSATETLTLDDMYVLGQQSYIKAVSPELSSAMTIRQDNVERTAQVSGVNVGYDKLQNVQFVSGRMFTQADLSNFRQYAVISDRTKKELFGTQTAVGKVILLDGVPSKIVGVLKQSSMYQDRSLAVWLPYTTFQARFSGASNHLSGITVSLQQGYSSALAVEGVTNLLTKRHGKKDFSIFNSDSLAKTIEKTATTLTLLISAIAVISLLVGGIGVMNIMLVSVTERTSEIGVRMAVGARYRDIIQQFLIEAIVVCFVGGVIGVALAFLVGGLLTLFDIKVLFSVGSIVLAVACSSLIGLVFGFMPAHRAAQMNPIDALNKA